MTIKKDREVPYTIITAQFENKESLRSLLLDILTISKKHGIDLSPSSLKGEKLLHFDVYKGAEALPIVTETIEIKA